MSQWRHLRLASLRIPNARRPIDRCGGHTLTVRAELSVKDSLSVLEGTNQELSSSRIPNFGCSVRRSGYEPSAIRTEANGPNSIFVSHRRASRPGGTSVPQLRHVG